MKDLAEILLETTLDRRQVADLTGLPLPLVAGCADVLDGCRFDGDVLRAMSESDREDYYRGQRLADAWFYGATAEPPTECEV